MRLWPRGIRKSSVNLWLKELGPQYPLLRAFKDGKISWPEFSRRYKTGLKTLAAHEQLGQLRAIAKKNQVTVLCGCKDPSHCHRTLLAKL